MENGAWSAKCFDQMVSDLKMAPPLWIYPLVLFQMDSSNVFGNCFKKTDWQKGIPFALEHCGFGCATPFDVTNLQYGSLILIHSSSSPTVQRRSRGEKVIERVKKKTIPNIPINNCCGSFSHEKKDTKNPFFKATNI